MGGRIAVQDHIVTALADDDAVAHDHGAISLIPLANGLLAKGAGSREISSLGLFHRLDDRWRGLGHCNGRMQHSDERGKTKRRKRETSIYWRHAINSIDASSPSIPSTRGDVVPRPVTDGRPCFCAVRAAYSWRHWSAPEARRDRR